MAQSWVLLAQKRWRRATRGTLRLVLEVELPCASLPRAWPARCERTMPVRLPTAGWGQEGTSRLMDGAPACASELTYSVSQATAESDPEQTPCHLSAQGTDYFPAPDSPFNPRNRVSTASGPNSIRFDRGARSTVHVHEIHFAPNRSRNSMRSRTLCVALANWNELLFPYLM